VPSQKGLLFECLHWQRNTVFFTSTSNGIGVNEVVLCDPSQKGWFLLCPQAHQKYLPGSNSTAAGCFAAILGSSIIFNF
jgi:hypothetical protein